MTNLLSMGLHELESRILEMGFPRYRADQLFEWMHGKGVFRLEEMQNLPKDFRRHLTSWMPPLPVKLKETVRGEDGTEKFRFALRDGGQIESVLIPEEKRATLCLSTQLGCAMGCVFCRTGELGFKRNLGADEILGQYYAIRGMGKAVPVVTHIVLMGMGEPLANLDETLTCLGILGHPKGCCISSRRITVSTVGIPEGIDVIRQKTSVSLTLSLNAADNETRSRLMPVNRTHPIEAVLDALKRNPLPPRRRYTVAYVLIQGVNDRREDANRLVGLLHGLRCKVNLIPFNPFPGVDLKRPEESAVLAFQGHLRSRGVSTHVRWSRGGDILGACGQLASQPVAAAP